MREVCKQIVSRVNSLGAKVEKLSGKVKITAFSVIAIFVATFGAPVLTPAHGSASRAIASMGFPSVNDASDEDEILKSYPAYLNFVLDISRETDARNAKRLNDLYQRLVRINPPGAARFLKGLRFEMVEKLELSGMNPAQATTRNPEMRRWVTKFLRDWTREADENLFRSIALRASLRNKKN